MEKINLFDAFYDRNEKNELKWEYLSNDRTYLDTKYMLYLTPFDKISVNNVEYVKISQEKKKSNNVNMIVRFALPSNALITAQGEYLNLTAEFRGIEKSEKITFCELDITDNVFSVHPSNIITQENHSGGLLRDSEVGVLSTDRTDITLNVDSGFFGITGGGFNGQVQPRPTDTRYGSSTSSASF